MALEEQFGNNTSQTAARFASIEATYDAYREVIDSEVIPVDALPIFVRLGKNTMNTLAIIRPDDLTVAEQDDSPAVGGEGHALNLNMKTFIIQPDAYNITTGKGYKALRDGESVEVGRSHQSNLPRFADFHQGVSRDHVAITKSQDGKTITVTDLGSSNGTYIATAPERTEPITKEFPIITSHEQEPIIVNKAVSASLASEKHPNRNEDSQLVDTENNMYGVFDGMGGYAGGEIASAAARDLVASRAPYNDTFDSLNAAETYLNDILFAANYAVLNRINEAATTAVIAKIHELNGQQFASIAHSGDSRAYLLRNGVLKAITVDHTPFRHDGHTQEAIAQQERLSDTDVISVLSIDDQIAFRNRNVIGACLGRDDDVRIDVKHIAVQPGDSIILTSDGVHDNLKTTEMQQLLLHTDPAHYANILTRAANSRAKQSHDRAKMDDITAVVVTI
ncbi:MAG: FHA domain-containing protein [Candidatus Microsaccharimonas sp.]